MQNASQQPLLVTSVGEINSFYNSSLASQGCTTMLFKKIFSYCWCITGIGFQTLRSPYRCRYPEHKYCRANMAIYNHTLAKVVLKLI
ncbi:hypothetical protein GDO78_009754 [Eleutherodactylus coqui]|uniref:Uncharacterized protein n=1 Tax=Eleutherodactylus coqui TaxID=57060 RepID=A0A8J6K8R8_ELECQ|nr:hypothetical protein GDO78_009754 [Eleutherodactylus coqui]